MCSFCAAPMFCTPAYPALRLKAQLDSGNFGCMRMYPKIPIQVIESDRVMLDAMVIA